MEKWIDKKQLVTGLLVVVIGFLLYKHFVRVSTDGKVQKTDIVLPGA